MNLVPYQYYIGETFKSSWQAVTTSVRCYDIIAGLLITIETLVQVGACLNHVMNNPFYDKTRDQYNHSRQ